MSTYVGSLRIAATDDVVEAVFEVTEHGLAVSSGGETLGTWPLDEIDLDDTGTEIYLALGGEEVIVNMRDRDNFVSEITPQRKPAGRHARPKRTRQPRPTKPAKEHKDVLGAVRRVFDRDMWRELLSDRVARWVIASVAVIIVALLALFATASLGMILVLIGMVALVVAALAVSEDLSAVSWVPANISESTLVVIGAVAMVLGGGLIVIS